MTYQRFAYVFELADLGHAAAPDALEEAIWRNPSPADKQALAELMLDSYRGTIDYDGETLEDARREVDSYFSNLDSSWLECSWLGLIGKDLACACLVGFWKDRDSPLIAYVMTASHWKGNRLATSGVSRSLHALAEKNCVRVHAVITEGNVPSERVFTRLGFSRVVPNQ